ncbi:Wadjet anti-phage system protein JetD domain-containing protein [Aquipuribacter nitratireducens]|uniref:Wadjet anti-phage system protein JetD domain-containing protein n=1 Tax=Aquipuribacter nitratireducens TaxID=650104 RepID=A0ABW0GJY6_9MICO
MSAAARWTTRADVVAALRRRWDRGEWLLAAVDEAPFAPVAIPLRRPTATQVRDRFDECLEWVEGWRDERARPLRIDRSPVGGRVSGVQHLPAHATLDSVADLVRLLGRGPEVQAFRGVLDATREHDPEVLPWVCARGRALLPHAEEWPSVLRALAWLRDPVNAGRYLREIQAPGVDTKLVERHRPVLAALLEATLPRERIDRSAPRADIATRFGFARRPVLVRWRWLSPPPPGWSYGDQAIRADELAAAPPPARTIVVVENEVTFLALPALPNTAAVWGKGYSLDGLREQRWLADRRVLYAGDLDTHGFAILDRLRSWFPDVVSVAMNERTLLAHRDRWGQEPSPSRAELTHLSREEVALYRDLRDDRMGPAVRLEQERIDFGWLLAELRAAIGRSL